METGQASAPREARPWGEHLARGPEHRVRGRGRSLEEAFEQAAVALCALVVDRDAVEVREEAELVCEATELDRLLADWLRAVVHKMASRHLLFRCFAVRMDGTRLFGHAFGEPWDRERHPSARDVRGVSLVGTRVCQGADGLWTAECEVEL
ncbi:archease [Corallococcus macrosporus]|uniref:Archease n=1 Tax=Corallococcus macrosporus DSM 14697 TaxID=1189310 RepID=A0A286NVJ8_9BACT|nr:archease [Corallococcus macrosporus]ATB51193.1 archease [Corallococcus macrosporus DSM 14697]